MEAGGVRVRVELLVRPASLLSGPAHDIFLSLSLPHFRWQSGMLFPWGGAFPAAGRGGLPPHDRDEALHWISYPILYEHLVRRRLCLRRSCRVVTQPRRLHQPHYRAVSDRRVLVPSIHVTPFAEIIFHFLGGFFPLI